MQNSHSVTTTLIGLVTLGASEALAATDLPQSPDSIFFTLAEQTEVKGPVYLTAGGQSDRALYTGELTTLILSEADRLASFWLEEDNAEAYVSFLVGALTVPLHESSLQHYRKLDRERGRCATGMNAGTVLRKAGQKVYDLFVKTAKTGAAPLVPECAAFNPAEPALQLLGSFDSLSTGLMQINFLAHPDYLPSGDFLDVAKTLRRGLEQYLRGFKALVDRATEFACVRGAREGEINFSNVIRGAWAGVYNSGNLGQSCRFTAPERGNATEKELKWARQNDVPFAKGLKTVLDPKGGFYAERLEGHTADPYRRIAGAFMSIGGGASMEQMRFDADAIHQEIATMPPVRAVPKSPRPIARAVVQVAGHGRLNVRTRPSTTARVRDTLRDGAPVAVYSRARTRTDRAGWLAITPAKDRWIHSRFVRTAR